MRHSRFFRLLTALFGVWFTFTLVQPNGMMGMTMDGRGMSMDMSAGLSSGDAANGAAMMTAREMVAAGVAHCEQMAQEALAQEGLAQSTKPAHASSHAEMSHDDAAQTAPAKKDAPACDQHDCCCSALSPMSLMPVASLSWLPAHIINERSPEYLQNAVDSNVQIRLPFANGPPHVAWA